MRIPKPISKLEFILHMEKCIPPGGLPSVLAVANSGGPDSTCLLFLLNQMIHDLPHPPPLNSTWQRKPQLLSITVDHRLQSTSITMAEHCANNARKLGIPHITTAIPWSQPPFPPSPLSGAKLELTARESRYHLLLDAMRSNNADTIAFGHHADDQVETLLMRMARGGSTGMRSVRRWGMGFGDGPGTLGWAGLDGMSKWIIRPLLRVGKDRILATCSQHKLDYVTDGTNFQPALTLRNAVRHWLTLRDDKEMPPLPSVLKNELDQVKHAAVESQLKYTLNEPETLRKDIQKLISSSEKAETYVTLILQSARRRSSSSTLLLDVKELPLDLDSDVKSRFVLRIIRFISPYPWGSPRAEAHRNSRNLQQAASRLWDPHARPSSFTVGGGVLWTPVAILSDGSFRQRLPQANKSERAGWLASRLPPLVKNRDPNLTTQSLDKNITDELLQAIDRGSEMYEMLWDCRFRITLDLKRMHKIVMSPGKIANVTIVSEGKWFLPRLVVQDESGQEIYSLSYENSDAIKEQDAHISFIRPLTEF